MGPNLMSVLAALLLLLSWFLPLFLPPWTGWHKEALTFAAALLAFGGLLWDSRGSRCLALPRVAGWFLGLGLVAAWQALTGTPTFRGDAFVLEAYLLVAAMVIAAGYAQRDVDKTAATLARLVLAAAVASALLSLVQTFNVWDLGEFENWIIRPASLRRPGANLGQPNHLAVLLLYGGASLAYLRRVSRVSARMAGFLGLILLTGLAVTESRSGILGLVLLSVWWWWSRPSRRTAFVAAATLAGFLALVLVWPQFHQLVEQDGGGIAHYNTNPVGRLVLWPQLWQAVLLKPWGGWGLHNVSEAHNAVVDAYPVSEPFTYAHNVLLDMAIGMGLPLTLLFSILAAVWLWRRLKAREDPASWYALALTLVLGWHSMLEYPYAYAYLLFPVLFMVGVLERRVAPAETWLVARRKVLLVYAITCVALVWSAVEYIALEEDTRIVRFEALRIGRTPDDYERPKIHLLKQLDAMVTASRLVPAPGMSAEEVELARQAAVRFPWTALQNRYALTLALNGAPEEAIRQLKVIRAMHGEKHYTELKANWIELAEEKYPQLQTMRLP